MDSIELSVVIPVYNCEDYLPDLLTSLRNQSGLSFEFIVINDGSTDSSAEILTNAARNDHRLILIETLNQGLSTARNTGIAHARGKWITFVDGDDCLAPDIFQYWITQARNQDLDLLIGNGYYFDTDPTIQSTPLLHMQPWGEVISGKQWIIRSVEQGEWPHFVWLQFIRRDIITNNKLGFIPNMIHEDILWTTHLALASRRVGFCKRSFYGYRQNPNSLTKSSAQKSLQQRANGYIDIIRELGDIAGKGEPELRRALLRHANHESCHFLGLIRKKITISVSRRDLAKKFITLGLPSSLFKGATNPSEY
jgi:glycosyltransferase involved in cell wall biosynthesis